MRVETLSVQRAREFRELHEALLLEEDGRAQLLLDLRKLAARHTCATSSCLEDLIDQELYLMSTGVKSARLRHLRDRIRLCFLRLARSSLRQDDRVKVCVIVEVQYFFL